MPSEVIIAARDPPGLLLATRRCDALWLMEDHRKYIEAECMNL